MAVTRLNTGEKPKRGELYYVYPQASWDNDDSEKGTSRTDVKSGRPAIVIGNDAGNGASDMCVIAWLTLQYLPAPPKNQLCCWNTPLPCRKRV